MSEPTTEAGKVLLEDWEFLPNHEAIIAAVEAEARERVLRELREEVERMASGSPSGVCVFRSAVLDAIDKRLEKSP